MKHLVTPSILVLLFGLVGPASAVTTLDFESLDQAGTSFNNPASYQQDGFQVSAGIGGLLAPQQGSPFRRDSVTVLTSAGFTTVTVDRIDGGTFDLLSMDFGSVIAGMGSATITGHLSGGGTVSQMLNYNTPAAPAPLEAFSSFSGFTGLTSVTWADTSGTSFDNLVFDNIMPAVPEPATVVLMGLGLVGLGFTGRRKLVS